MVRVASLKSQVEADIQNTSEDGLSPQEQLLEIREKLIPLLKQQYKHFEKDLKRELRKNNIYISIKNNPIQRP